jgi:hypothetical protein
VADVTIDSAILTSPRLYQRCVATTSAFTGYVVFLDTDAGLKYAKTTTAGASWTGPVTIHAGPILMFDICYDGWVSGDSGATIHVAYMESSASLSDNVYYRPLDTNTDTLGTQTTIFAAASIGAPQTGQHVSLQKSRGGNLLCHVNVDNGTEVAFRRSVDNGASWTTRAHAYEAAPDTLILYAGNAGDPQDIWAIYNDASANELTLKVYDDSADSWSESAAIVTVVETSSVTEGYYQWSGAVRFSDGHLILAVITERDTATSDFRVFNINGTASIAELTAAATDTDDLFYPQVTIDQTTDDIYLSYTGKRDGSENLGTTVGVYYTFSTDDGATWNALDTVISETTGNIQQNFAPPSGDRFLVVWIVDGVNDALTTNGDNSILFTTVPTSLLAAETELSDPSTWYGGRKPAKLISVSEITRELSRDGDFHGVECRVVVSDVDRTYRTAANQFTIAGAYAALYIVSDDTRYAQGTPYRIFAGRVQSHRALPGFQYEFVLRDVMSDLIAKLDESPRVPPDRFATDFFPGLDEAFNGQAIPLVIGQATDENEDIPQGVIPPIRVGSLNFQTAFGGINQDVYACIWSLGALSANGVWQVYYNNPSDPDLRVIVPASAFGVAVWTPGMPGWSDTGLATDYADYPTSPASATRRYTPFFISTATPLIDAFLDGRVLVAANLYGLSEDAEAGDIFISDPSRVWQWLITNQLLVPYRTGAYAAIPTFPGNPGVEPDYSVINTNSVELARTRHHARLTGGYPVGFMLGRGGQQQTLRHVLAELCRGTDMDQGIDRHGRLMVDVEDVDAAATYTLSDLHDIEDGEFEVWIDRENYFNRLEHLYAYRYVPASAPRATPPEGEPLPAQPLAPYSEWVSGLVVTDHAAAQTANRDVAVTHLLENFVVRDDAVAANLADYVLARAVGPSPGFDGARMFRLTTSYQALNVELGDVIEITHLEGFGASGYEGQRGRVLSIKIDPQRARITLEGRILVAGSP